MWVLEGYRRLGWTEAKLLANYPTLRAAGLVHAWAYVVDLAAQDSLEEQLDVHVGVEGLGLKLDQEIDVAGKGTFPSRNGAKQGQALRAETA